MAEPRLVLCDIAATPLMALAGRLGNGDANVFAEPLDAARADQAK